jgi:hypothetical protein
MPGHRTLLSLTGIVAITAVVLVAAAVPASGADLRPGIGAHPSHVGGELVFVANAGSGPVTVYPAQSSGPVAPVDSVPDPDLDNTVWDPWGVTFDPAGDLFVQSFVSDATTFVFPWGQTSPSRAFRVDGPDSRSIAVDATGYEYVATGESAARVSVAAPGAAGTSSNFYAVPAVRTITTSESGYSPWPSTLAVDPSGDLVVATVSPQGNAVEVFEGGGSGSDTPIRALSGTATDLGTCTGFDTCDHLAVATSARTGRLYVAVTTSAGARIEEFAASSDGDVAPARTIMGKRTGLVGKVVTGLAVDPKSGDIYAMVRSSQFSGRGSVEAFSAHANGNVAPRRAFTDATNGFADAQGIAVVSPPAIDRFVTTGSLVGLIGLVADDPQLREVDRP